MLSEREEVGSIILPLLICFSIGLVGFLAAAIKESQHSRACCEVCMGAEKTHWVPRWDDRTPCGHERIRDVAKVVVASREALRKETLDHITCPECRKAASACMYSVAPP